MILDANKLTFMDFYLSIFEIVKEIDLYENEIENVQTRLDYDLRPDDCTDVVLNNGNFVGAFKLAYCTPLDIRKRKADELRLFWLAVTHESRDEKLGVGGFIIEHAIDYAKREEQDYLCLSVNIENGPAMSLYTKYRFSVRVQPSASGDQDLVLYV